MDIRACKAIEELHVAPAKRREKLRRWAACTEGACIASASPKRAVVLYGNV